MTVTSMTVGEAAAFAMDIFRVGTGERPDLIRTGIPIVDSTIGGLFPGTLVVIGAEQGTGKSGLVLSAVLESPEVSGGIFLEDGPDLVGGRSLAYFSGVNSLDLRFAQRLTKGKVKMLQDAAAMLQDRPGSFFEFALGGTLEEITACVRALGEKGCRVIFLDYLQKVRGVNDNRRSEIGIVMTTFQRACLEAGAVPVLCTQLRRRSPTKDVPEPRFEEPRLSDFKESGDIESEARVALLLWPSPDERTLHGRFAKSSFGGEGAKFTYVRGSCGSLKPAGVTSDIYGEI